MIRYVNKTEFRTKIGVLYCLWEDRADGITVLFLGCKKEAFRKYIEKIKDNFSGSDRFSVINKESKEIENKITKYLSGKIRNFNFKTKFLKGTQFQKKIWNVALSIPYGKTTSYRKLANLAGYRKAWRAAGSALKNNPIILIVPCHRVIRSDGAPGEFGGGKKVKKFLLSLEKSPPPDTRFNDYLANIIAS
ncbi:Methylated-DNA--protein-cysteine methyltransferase [subsurface metagenome]|nr:methylated-DNA--[protein]-cysteine S-methyltransferase [Clostridia bacterium]